MQKLLMAALLLLSVTAVAEAQTVPATIVNTMPNSLIVIVNNGAARTIPAASGPNGLVPSQANVTFSNSGPSQGVLGPGNNMVVVNPPLGRFALRIALPNQRYQSLQIYLFRNQDSTLISWVALESGTIVAKGETGPFARR